MGTFAYYRAGFLIFALSICSLTLFKANWAWHFRLFPLMFLGSFSSMYNQEIGQYGVYRKIDAYIDMLQKNKESEVGKMTEEFVKSLDL